MTPSAAPAAPAPGVPDTDVMVAVHTFFRRELRLAGAAVRAVAPGDVRRARTRRRPPARPWPSTCTTTTRPRTS